MMIRSSPSNSCNNRYNKALFSPGKGTVTITRGCREIIDRLRNCSRKSDAQSQSERMDQSATEMNGNELLISKFTSLLIILSLIYLNIHTFWSHSIRSLNLLIGGKTIVFQMCDISARNGWFFQRMWPIIERLLSKLVPAVLLLSLSLYGLYSLRSINSKSNLQSLQSLAILQSAIPSNIVRSQKDSEFVRQESNIEISDSSLNRHQRQMHRRECRVGIETREQLRVILLIALLTSVATLQENAIEFMAAVKPTLIGYSTREWLLVLLISHTLSLLVECATLPLCLALTAHFRRQLCSLICFLMKRDDFIS